MPKLTNAMFDTICEEISAGEWLKDILAPPTMCSRKAFHKAVLSDDTKGAAYTRARNLAQDARVERLEDIARDPDLDHHQRRLMCDNIKWVAGRLAKEKYGDNSSIDITERQIVTAEPMGEGDWEKENT